MKTLVLNNTLLNNFKRYLKLAERSSATIEKYVRDISALASYVGGEEVTKEKLICYKNQLISIGYSINSINSMLASINSFLGYIDRFDLKIKSIKVQRKLFCSEERELTKQEYERLVKSAKERNDIRLSLIIQTICGTGIRISELEFITVEAVKRGEAIVKCKGKTRPVILVKALQKALLDYAKANGIKTGSIFITRSGKPVDRSNVWKAMKAICMVAKVDSRKVFPHNLRHLFARVFYEVKKDIVKLADVLGHDSINTTRIYTISTGAEHRHYMEQMRLIL